MPRTTVTAKEAEYIQEQVDNWMYSYDFSYTPEDIDIQRKDRALFMEAFCWCYVRLPLVDKVMVQ